MRIYTYAPPLTRSQVIIVNMCIPQRTCMYDRVYAYILVYIHTPLPLFPILLSITPNTSQHTLYIPYLHLIHLHHTHIHIHPILYIVIFSINFSDPMDKAMAKIFMSGIYIVYA